MLFDKGKSKDKLMCETGVILRYFEANIVILLLTKLPNSKE